MRGGVFSLSFPLQACVYVCIFVYVHAHVHYLSLHLSFSLQTVRYLEASNVTTAWGTFNPPAPVRRPSQVTNAFLFFRFITYHLTLIIAHGSTININ